MSDKYSDDNNKVIHFPDINRRKSSYKDELKRKKSQDALEKKYRAEYRASRAKELSNNARTSAVGKVPMIKWHRIPIFTRIIVAIFLAVQVFMGFFLSASDKFTVISNFGFVPAIYSGSQEWSWIALLSPFTSLLIHGGWMHLAFNIVMMLAMGVFFERQFGAKLTAIFFVLCGLAGNLVCFILSPESSIPVIGASGAISGLFAASFIMMIEQGLMGVAVQRRGSMPIILLWSVIIIVFGMLSNDVSWQSHIGGFLCGVGLFHLLKRGILPMKRF